MKTNNLIFTVLAIIILLISCGNNDDETNSNSTRNFGIFKVLDDDTTIEMNGPIGSLSLINFNDLVNDYPNVNQINIRNCDGSDDDDVNLQLSLKVHQKGMNIHLMDNGGIASGGVDFFLAGIQRTKGTNTKISVHSWASDNGKTAIDYERGHAVHLPYINYYMSVGFTQQQAKDFYYFTIYAAPADSFHDMTDAEIAKYNMVTQ